MPTHETERPRIIAYITATSFKQVSLAKLCQDLKLESSIACRYLKQYIDDGILEKGRSGKLAIYSIKTAEVFRKEHKEIYLTVK